jgi:hypothetical protein
VLAEHYGLPYRLDLERCHRALIELQIEGELGGMRTLAYKIGVSFSTVSRFFCGRLPSLKVTLQILDRLHLTFDQVATRDDDEDGRAGEGTRQR